jgi:hypothetical protein
MAKLECEVTVTMAWWFRPYVKVLCFVAVATGKEPDWDRFQHVIAAAMRIKMGPARLRKPLGSGS